MITHKRLRKINQRLPNGLIVYEGKSLLGDHCHSDRRFATVSEREDWPHASDLHLVPGLHADASD